MSKKKVIILSIVLILAIAYISRVAYVNIVQAPVKIVQYSIGDKIKHCNYQLQVTKYKILYKDEFIKKYGEFSDDSYDDDDYAFILVNMNYKMLSDKNYKNYKFSPFDIQAQYNAISLIPDLDLYYDVMPDDYEVVEKVGDSTTIILPYAFAKSNLTEEHWKNFKNLDFKLSLNDAENKKIEINLKK